jgi:hypothetical protein
MQIDHLEEIANPRRLKKPTNRTAMRKDLGSESPDGIF